jgi:AraC-like DNA-binding protein
MIYNTYTPSKPLEKYIKYYWTLENARAANPQGPERIFPDGCVELMFHYGDVFRKYLGAKEVYTQSRSFIHGQLKNFIEVEPTGKIGTFSIRFTPAGLHHFLPINIDDITEHDVSVADLWGRPGAILEEQIMEAPDAAKRIRIVENFLLKRLTVAQNSQDIISHCVCAISTSRGLVSIDKLSKDINIGKRHLERKFLNAVGLSPKLFTRIIRFQYALNVIDKMPQGTLTGVAYDMGFYDQSHFIKDFREFTGLNPKQYFVSNLEFAKHLLTP